jgi:hypothetical protein
MNYQIFKHLFKQFGYQMLVNNSYPNVIGHHHSPVFSFQSNFQLVKTSGVKDHGNYGYCYMETLTVLIDPIWYWQFCLEVDQQISRNQLNEFMAKYLFEINTELRNLHFVTIPLGTGIEGRFAKRFAIIENIILENPIENEKDELKINELFQYPNDYQNYLGFLDILNEVGKWNDESTEFSFDGKTVQFLENGQQWTRGNDGEAILTKSEVLTVHLGITNFNEHLNEFEDDRYAQKLFGKYLFEQGIQTLPLNLIF